MMDLLKEDVDKLLSYNTKQQVEILDRWLGLTNIGIQLGIMLYVGLYIFGMRSGYLLYEQARGVATTSVYGDVLAVASGQTEPRYFNADDLVYPPLENGNIFIATKVEISHEERGVCEDVTMVCETVEDCSKPPKKASWTPECMPTGFCKEPSWCLYGDPAEKYSLDVGHFQVWIRTAIQFYKLNLLLPEDKRQTFGSAALYPTPKLYGGPAGDNSIEDFNTFLVTDLLNMCVPPVRIEEVSELGAAIEIQFNYDCNVGKDAADCKPVIKARRIDAVLDQHNIGYAFSYPLYDDDDKNKRQLYSVRGLRFYVRTSGIGEKTDISIIILMLSTAVALLGFAPVFTDLLMIYTFKLKKKYYARKYEHSQDFSDIPIAADEASDDEEEEEDFG